MRVVLVVMVAAYACGCARAESRSKAAQRAAQMLHWPRATAAEMKSGSAETARREFDQALDRIAQITEPEERAPAERSEVTSIEDKLAAIALDRSAHPERYRVIWESYVVPRKQATRSGGPQPLLPEHGRPDYRLAWEYYLLAPPATVTPSYRTQAFQAVADIGDKRSCRTLLYLLQSGVSRAGADSTLRSCDACTQSLYALARIAEPEAAQAIAEAFPVAGSGAREGMRKEAISYLVEEINGMWRRPERQRQWQRIAEEASRSASPELRELGRELGARLRPVTE